MSIKMIELVRVLIEIKALRWCILGLLVPFIIMAGVACGKRVSHSPNIHIGFFPNITHAQAIIGLAKGVFSSHLGHQVEIKATPFNAGPSIIEAIFAEDIDIAYVGPSPAINGYVRSGGKALKIIAGVANGGALFIVRKDLEINDCTDLSGRKIASPQLGNTQDIALREYIRKCGLKPEEKGGTVHILPLRNPDILSLFMRKQIDGAWVPEPWASRLIREADGKIFLDEKSLWENGRFCSTLMVANTNFLEKHQDLVRHWLAAHVEITRWINQHLEEAKDIVAEEIKAISGISLPKEIVNDAFSRIEFTYDPVATSLYSYAEMAYRAGFLGNQEPNLSEILDLQLLNEVLDRQSLALIEDKKSLAADN